MKIKDIENGILEEEFDDNLLLEVTAYHGSAYNFDKFDVAFIGKGEHGQAHGWGLYFSFGKGVAQGYRSRISSMNAGNQFRVYTYKGKSYESGTIMYSLLSTLTCLGKKDTLNKIDRILKDKEYMSKHPAAAEYLEKAKKEFGSLKTGDLKVKPVYEEGNFYTVQLPEFDYYLVEEDTFDEQSDFVQKCLKEMSAKNPSLNSVKNYMEHKNYSARGFYSALQDEMGSPKKASLLLNEYGIVGIRYEGNIDKGCAVLFNNNDITLVTKATEVEKDELRLPEMIAIEEDPDYIAQIKNPSYELQIAAVMGRASSVKYIDNPDERVVDYVLEKNPSFIVWIKNPSKELIEKYMDKIGTSTLLDVFMNIKDESTKEYFLFKLIDNDIDFFKIYCVRGLLKDDSKELIEKILDSIKRKYDTMTIANVINNIDRSMPFHIVEIFQDKFFNWKPYKELSAGDRSLNYYVTSVYFCNDDMNKAPKNVRERCLSWNWYHTLPELLEFTMDDLNIFKKNYKLGYLNEGQDWTTFELNNKCKISDEVMNELMKFIKQIRKNGIVIDYNLLVNYMSIEDLYEICDDNLVTLRKIYDNMYSKDKQEKLFLNVFEHKIKSIKDINSEYGVALMNVASSVIRELGNNHIEVFKNNDLLTIMAIKYINKNKSYFNKDLLKDVDANVQKYIISQNVELLKYVNNVDKTIQNKLIEKNPFYIKFINNPDKQVVEKATKMNPMIVDYIRN